MKKNYIIISALVIAVLLTGIGLFVWQGQNTTQNTPKDNQASNSATATATTTPTPTTNQANQPSASQTVQPVEQTVKLYLVAIGDTQAGTEIGCGDSLVGVTKQLTTTTPLTDTLKALLAIKDEYYGQSGLYNALWQSNVVLDSVAITNGVATIALSGDLQLGGTCDSPRVKGQLTAIATQFSTVTSANITLNGQPLDQALSPK